MRCAESVISQPCGLPKQCRSAGDEVLPGKWNRTCAARRFFQTDATFGCRQDQWRRGRYLGDLCRCWQREGYFQHRPSNFRTQCGRRRSEVRPLLSMRWRSRLLQQARFLERWPPLTASASSPIMSPTCNSLANRCTSLTRSSSRARSCSQPARATPNSCEGQESARDLMQRRPLKMVLLKGTTLPVLFGHCIIRGKTQLTVTTPTAGIWQVGGEIAERLARQENSDNGRQAAMHESGVAFLAWISRASRSLFTPATRAEAKTAEQKRPSGVHVSRVAPGICCRLAHQTLDGTDSGGRSFRLGTRRTQTTGGTTRSHRYRGRRPLWRAYPWEEVEWFPAR